MEPTYVIACCSVGLWIVASYIGVRSGFNNDPHPTGIALSGLWLMLLGMIIPVLAPIYVVGWLVQRVAKRKSNGRRNEQ